MTRAAGSSLPLVLPVVLATLLAAVAGSAAEERIFILNLEHGAVPPDMQVIQVQQGDQVKLRWTTDKTIVVHLHGYDLLKTVEPGELAEMSFDARAAGRFPVSEHVPDAAGHGHHGHRSLLRLEVRPR
jgi:hypothetical protein